MSIKEAIKYFKEKKPRCPDCGLELSQEKEYFVCWICHNKFEVKEIMS